MARKKSTTAITSESEVVAEKTVETPVEETKIETQVVETVKKEAEKKEETINDTDKVWIQNPKSAYKKIRVLVEVYAFDGEGKALVSGKDAKLFLTHPGYELVK